MIYVILPWNFVTKLYSSGFINHVTRMEMICWFFICKNRPIYVCHACPGWAGRWAAARFVWIELFLLTIVFLQISVPALARPSHTRQLWNLTQEGRRVLENSLMQEQITGLLPDLPGLTITAFLFLIESKMISVSKKLLSCAQNYLGEQSIIDNAL